MSSEDKDCVYVMGVKICVGDVVDVSIGRHRVIGQIKEINRRFGVLILSDGGKDVALRAARIYLISKIS